MTPAFDTFDAETEAEVDADVNEAIEDEAELPGSAVEGELYPLAVTIDIIDSVEMLLEGASADEDGATCEDAVTDEPS